LTFSLEGPPAGASIDPALGSFVWATPADWPAGTNWLTVRVSDDGMPSLSSTLAFAVEVKVPGASGIIITPPSSSGEISVTFPVVAGHHYRVEYTEDLEAGSWLVLPGYEHVLATGPSLSVPDNVLGKTQRFYHILPLD
jgi:hypothetical protein